MKNKVLNKKITYIISMVMLASLMFLTCFENFTVSAATDAPYNGYYYDQWGESRPSPNGYNSVASLTAKEFGIDDFGTVNDLVSDKSGNLYILDSDKSLIYKSDKDLKNVETITILKDGEVVSFKGANGFTVSDNEGVLKIYIADTENQRILVADNSGTVERIILKPETDLIDDEQTFLPIKLVVSEDNSLFVLCQQMYDGAILLDDKGEFLGFFGSNKVEVDAKLLSDNFWKNVLGEKFRDKFSKYVPREYSNLTIDDKGFIYTTTLVTADSSTQIRRLNWKSSNILSSESFGDLDNMYGANKFIDIAAMNNGLFAALDTKRGRIFIYGEDGEAVTVFGGSGVQDGVFRTAVAIESIDDNIYIFDQSTKRLSKFAPTEYGETLLKATRMFIKGDYRNSEPLWQDILRQNGGYEKAYISIGRYLVEEEKFDEALSYFKKGGANEDYSDAFEQVRSVHTRKWFTVYAIIFVGILILVMFLLRNKGSYKNEYETSKTGFFAELGYALFHPINGISKLVCANMVMNFATIGIMFATLMVSICDYQFTGFIFNNNEPGKMDVVSMFITIFGLFIIVVVANWLVITMADGKGKLIEIANVIAFALIPILGAEIINIILSNFLILNEQMFLAIFTVIGYSWGVMIFVLGLGKIHQFTFSRNLFMLLLTVIAVCIILVLLLLCFSIEKQLELFFKAIIDELKMII